MAANLDVYQVVDTSTYQGQKCLNVYFYQRNSLAATTGADDLADEWIANVLPAVLDVQVPEVVHTQLDVINLFDPSDRVTIALSEPGTGAGAGSDQLPVFNAVGATLVQDNGAIRNGSKRYTGLQEAVQTSGVITSAPFLAVLDALGTAILDALPVGVVDTFFPVIVKRILDGGEYRLPANLGEAVIGGIVDAVFNVLVTSQTSRKIGNGE